MAMTLTAERRRLLRMLARCPSGCAEALLMAYGFSIKFLAGVVFDGLATAQPSTTRAGGREVIVVWMQITEAGRRAIGFESTSDGECDG
jgi:hypothetical protein